jgi:16S rRNA (adenine1518-N6/adenine1519-N6)-dimethyltransferase
MLLREVADRLVAKPGTKAYGVLSILTQRHAAITKRLDLPPAAFTPPPKVRSSLVRLTFHPPTPRVPDETRFAAMVKALFSQRRKMLANALKRFDPAGPDVLARSGLDGRRRPETLDLDELARLADLFAGTARSAVL